MRATAAIDESARRAFVALRPCWLARLFGAREVVCVLEPSGSWPDGSLRLRFAHTQRDVRGSRYGELILAALEFQPVVPPPPAIARRA